MKNTCIFSLIILVFPNVVFGVSYMCDFGYFLPANSETCAPCPTGYVCDGGTFDFNASQTQGVLRNSARTYNNELKMCATNYEQKMVATFTPKSATCNFGYFLPANSETCAPCPAGYQCNGGTYVFSDANFSGLIRNNQYHTTTNETKVCADNFERGFVAVFRPKTITCDAGKYVNANSIECNQTCPSNHYCPGGNFLFNENENVGIYQCTSGTYSPSGSAVCYQHILHVGDDIVYLRSTKLTTPSLNIQIGNDIFYANMTTTPTYMNKDSSHYLHILYEGEDYYVCDDTTYQE